MDNYHVPAGYGEAEYTEKRSRFIGRVWRIENEQDAQEYLKETREKYWDATHNVYAYSVNETGIARYSDDGEPSGTSGMPVLNVFRSAGIDDFCCVITRYFGGTLLGTGGLVRAYTKTASAAMQYAGLAEMKYLQSVMVTCTYSQYERIKAELIKTGNAPEKVTYGSDVVMVLAIPDEIWPSVEKRIGEISSFTAKVELMGKAKKPVKINQS